MEAVYLRDVLTRLPTLFKRRQNHPHRRLLLFAGADQYQQHFNDTDDSAAAVTKPPQIDIELDFSEDKIDEGLPHLASEMRYCFTCSDTKPIWQFPSIISYRCDHDVGMCRPCLANWIETSLRTSGYERINCAQCAAPLTADEVKMGASEEVYKRYFFLFVLSLFDSNDDVLSYVHSLPTLC